MQWDLFCRVIDNLGDVGVCWRLASDLAGRGERVRLWIDDARPLAWMAPAGGCGVELRPWSEAGADEEPGDIVIEAFGCELPSAFVDAMALRTPAPLWINLEYLSAESYVERSHGLPSPRSVGPGAGLNKWFFYPGFTSATGGLLREPGLLDRREAFDRSAWLAQHDARPGPGQHVVSLFCYDGAPVAAFCDLLARSPLLLLVTPGAAQHAVRAWRARRAPMPSVRVIELPWLTQAEYDRLLWSCDLNFVRGEDSFVRAQWAGVPFVWQIYPQHDGVHAGKLDAFIERFCTGAPGPLAHDIHTTMRAWNGLVPALEALPDRPAWTAHAQRWRDTVAAQADLASQLSDFCRARLPPAC